MRNPEHQRQQSSDRLKRLHADGVLGMPTDNALRVHGQCEATARSTKRRCLLPNLPGRKRCYTHSTAKRKRSKSWYYRRSPRQTLVKQMYQDRQSLADAMAELTPDDRQLVMKQSNPYVQRVAENHSDKTQLIEYLEQRIIFSAIHAVQAGSSWRLFNEAAESFAAGTHGLPVRLTNGSYASDDRWTLPKGTVVSKTDITHLPDVAGARQKQMRIEQVKEKSANAHTVMFADLVDELNK